KGRVDKRNRCVFLFDVNSQSLICTNVRRGLFNANHIFLAKRVESLNFGFADRAHPLDFNFGGHIYCIMTMSKACDRIMFKDTFVIMAKSYIGALVGSACENAYATIGALEQFPHMLTVYVGIGRIHT